MRVKMTHHKTRGGFLFTKTYHVVTTSVTFSREEKFVIRQDSLTNLVLVDRPPGANKIARFGEEHLFYLYVKDIWRGSDSYYLSNGHGARMYMEDVAEALQKLKGAMGGDPEDVVFDL